MVPRTRDMKKTPASTTALVPNQKATLLIAVLSVGTAILFKRPNRIRCRKWHVQELSAGPEQDLVVVSEINILAKINRLPYHYHFPGPEGSPPSLKDLYKSEIYVWDLNNVKNQSFLFTSSYSLSSHKPIARLKMFYNSVPSIL